LKPECNAIAGYSIRESQTTEALLGIVKLNLFSDRATNSSLKTTEALLGIETSFDLAKKSTWVLSQNY